MRKFFIQGVMQNDAKPYSDLYVGKLRLEATF